MVWWLVGVTVCLLIWGGIWKSNLLLAFGILLGVLLAWLLSFFVKPYVTDMENIPIWLPPLPLATVAIILFVYGAVVWFKGNEGLSKKDTDDSDQH